MRYFFLIYILFLSQINASPLTSVESDKTKLTNFKLEYFVDKSNSLSFEKVKIQNFTKATSSLSLGVFQEVTWLRFKLHNSTQKKQNIYLHNENAYIANKLDFYALKNNKTLNSLHINLRNKTQTDEKMFGTDSIFIISLDINETQEIYIKSLMSVMQYPHFTLYDEKNSKRQISKNNSLLFIIVGMLLSLGLYHLILYFSTRYKSYLYYSLYMFSAVVWEALLSGLIANNFGVYFTDISEKFLLSIALLPLFLALFSKSIFDTKINYKKENKHLNSVIILSGSMFIFGFYNLYLTLVLMSNVYIYMFGVLFFTTYSIMKKGNPFALIFLVANTIFSLFMIVTNLYYMGFINYSFFAFNSASIGVITEAIILSFLLSYRFKILQDKELISTKELAQQDEIKRMNTLLHSRIVEEVEKSRQKDKMLFEQQKLVSMGEMIENIAHQWRQPLSQINSSVLLIDTYLDDNNIQNDDIEKELQAIENLSIHMSKTINSFKNFFEPNKVHTEFSISKLIDSSLAIATNSILNSNIKIEVCMDKSAEYFGLENELQQVIIILLNNANDALIQKDTLSPKIRITIEKLDQSYKISICDNAQGVEPSTIDKIFEPYFTTKHKAQGTGLGLYISKVIIEENMSGTLSVHNNQEGACFVIELPILI